MSCKIKQFADGAYIEFDRGKFDDWCVYFVQPGKKRFAPTDVQYFRRLRELGTKHGNQQIYDDFVQIYEKTGPQIEGSVLQLIEKLSLHYAQDSRSLEILFAILYAGMVAEENKQFAVLKKRIKRLGMHQILLLNFSAQTAASFSKGKKWQELDKICRKLGF